MANSYTDYVGDGSTTLFNVPFSYIDRSHVGVYVDGESVPFSWITGSTVDVTPAPANGVNVRIRRITPKDPVVDFQDGENLTEQDLDNVNRQGLFLAQETEDNLTQVMAIADTGHFDGLNRRITNVATPVNPQDAVTKAYADATKDAAVSSIQAAQSTAQSAIASDRADAEASIASDRADAEASIAADRAAAEASIAADKAAAEAAASGAAAAQAGAEAAQAAAETAKTGAETAETGSIAAKVAAEIARDAAIAAQVQAEATAAAVDGVPVGTVLYLAFDTVPTGYLKANGAAVSRTTYSALFAKIGTTYGAGDGSTTFNIPDARGVVPRGLDDGRGLDSGRALGSYQADDFKSHNHWVDPPNTSTTSDSHNHTLTTKVSATFSSGGSKEGWNDGSGSSEAKTTSTDTHSHTVNIGGFSSGSTGGSETRMKNIAFLPVIKY